MNLFMKILKSSLTYRLVLTAGSSVKAAVIHSYVYELYFIIKEWYEKNIIQSRIYQYIFDPNYITDAWYKSLFYRRGTYGLRKLSLIMPKPTLKWRCLYIGCFIAFILLIPQKVWADSILQFSFIVLSVFYFAHFAYSYTGTGFGLINILFLLFWGVLALVVPYSAARTLGYLIMGIDFFFLISFSVRTKEDFNTVLCYIYVTLFALCAIGFVQQAVFGITAQATFADGIAFGEIILLLFPFSFIYPMGLKSKTRRLVYIAVLIMLTFNVVTATASKAALIGYAAELILLILLIDMRYLPVLIFLGPALTGNAIENIILMWDRPETYGNFFSNIFYSFKNFWDNGFGVSRTVFMDIYTSTTQNAESAQFSSSLLRPEVSRAYFLFLLDLGALLMIGFLSYILRLAHSALTSIFAAQPEHRAYFAAGFVTLIGISVSSMLESAIFSPRTLLIYWGMLGLLRAARIIRFGITR